MLKFVILLSAVACALGAAIPEEGRVAGGDPTTISTYPWQVSIQRNGDYLCAGTIYNNSIILTSANCVQYMSASDLTVRAGSAYRSSGGSLVAVAAIKTHEQFNVYNKINDIAVIRLSTALTFSDKIKNIELATAVPAHGALATISGWGTTVAGAANIPEQLRDIEVDFIRREICASKTFSYGLEIKPTMVCAAAPDKGFCKGDVGSALVSDGALVGIASWGCGCADIKSPGVFASIVALKGWILNAVKVV